MNANDIPSGDVCGACPFYQYDWEREEPVCTLTGEYLRKFPLREDIWNCARTDNCNEDFPYGATVVVFPKEKP